MKGLIFNLLDSMARQSGCADEAWDLVMEFVANETEPEAQADTCLSCFEQADSALAFDSPAEAMIACLGSESSASFSEFPELALSEAEERLGDSIPALVDPDFCARRPSPEGFSHDLLALLEQLLAEALVSGDEEDDDGDDFEQDEPALLPSFARRSS